MTMLRPQTGAITRPSPGPISEPYWEGCRVGELRFQRCDDCGGATHTPAVLCAHCSSSALHWEVSTGRGTVYSWTTVWRPVTPAFEVPYQPVVVAMEEGFWFLSCLVDCDHEAVHEGLEVEVMFHALDDGFVLPYVRPRTPGD